MFILVSRVIMPFALLSVSHPLFIASHSDVTTPRSTYDSRVLFKSFHIPLVTCMTLYTVSLSILLNDRFTAFSKYGSGVRKRCLR